MFEPQRCFGDEHPSDSSGTNWIIEVLLHVIWCGRGLITPGLNVALRVCNFSCSYLSSISSSLLTDLYVTTKISLSSPLTPHLWFPVYPVIVLRILFR